MILKKIFDDFWWFLMIELNQVVGSSSNLFRNCVRNWREDCCRGTCRSPSIRRRRRRWGTDWDRTTGGSVCGSCPGSGRSCKRTGWPLRCSSPDHGSSRSDRRCAPPPILTWFPCTNTMKCWLFLYVVDQWKVDVTLGRLRRREWLRKDRTPRRRWDRPEWILDWRWSGRGIRCNRSTPVAIRPNSGHVTIWPTHFAAPRWSKTPSSVYGLICNKNNIFKEDFWWFFIIFYDFNEFVRPVS